MTKPTETTEAPAVAIPLERQVRHHTPGPWRLSAPGDICYVAGPQGQYIIKRDSKKTWDKDAAARIVADCRLIAAAPDLLAALQELRYACTDKAEAMADAAIARAVG